MNPDQRNQIIFKVVSMKFHRVLPFIVISIFFFSCKPQQKLPTYLQYVNDTTGKGQVKIPDLIIQKGDQLSIQIMSLSTIPDKSDVLYNQPGASSTSGGSSTAGSGYLVDNNGDIIHHRLGVIHAEGLTKQELAKEIKKRLTEPVELLKDTTVVIHITNFMVTMLGQVGQQGPIKIPGEKITVLEAVGLAGGVSEIGKLTNIKILREQNGVRETGKIDLSSKDIFDSPYYYLVQNDVLIVDIDETNRKYKDAEQARIVQKISFAFTLVTVAATMANIFIKN